MNRSVVLLAIVLLNGCKKDEPSLDIRDRATQTRSPTVANREDIIRQRDSMAVELVDPGDTVMAYVFVDIDEQGLAHQPEVRPKLEDQRIEKAAIDLVMRMRFNPATEDGKPKHVMMKLPVQFGRPGN